MGERLSCVLGHVTTLTYFFPGLGFDLPLETVFPTASLPGCVFNVAACFRSAVSLKRTSSTWQILKEIWVELGYRGLFTGRADAGLQRPFCRLTAVNSSSGFLPRVFKVAPACAIMISTYEFGKSFFRRMNLDRERAAAGSPSHKPAQNNVKRS